MALDSVSIYECIHTQSTLDRRLFSSALSMFEQLRVFLDWTGPETICHWGRQDIYLIRFLGELNQTPIDSVEHLNTSKVQRLCVRGERFRNIHRPVLTKN